MSKVGKGIEKAVRGVLDIAVGGKPNINPGQGTSDTAQEAVDKAQGSANSALARRKNRSLLSMGMGATQAAKKLLGE